MIVLTGPDRMTVRVDAGVGGTLTGLHGPWEGDLLAPGLPLAPSPDAASPFVDSGLRGWVDCFPTIAPDRLDLGHRSLPVADHGELWFRDWEVETLTEAAVELRCELEDLDVVARKRVIWEGTGLRCRTEVTNGAVVPVPFVWAAHALFDLWPEDVLTLPPGTQESFRYRQFPDPAPYDEYWPGDEDGHRRWDDLPVGAMAKYFLEWPEGGVGFTCHGRCLRLEWSNAPETAQLGLWVNRHGFPAGRESVSHLGVEPGLGWPDELSAARRGGTAASLEPGETVVLDLTLHILLSSGK